MSTPRNVAYSVLMAVDKGGLSDMLLNEKLPELKDVRDKALATEIVYGTLEQQPRIDRWLVILTGKQMKRLDAPVRTILRMTAYQMLFLDKVPEFAAINEGVKLATRNCGRAKGFINGVLRELSRKKDQLPPHKPWSMSQSIEDMLKEQYSTSLLVRFNIRPKLQLRVNTLKTDIESFVEQVGATLSETEGIVELGGGIVPEIYGFDEGLFFVEGRASAEAVHALSPKKGARLLDMCSSPGGKTFAAALLMQNEGSITSRDISKAKTDRIEEGARRLGIDIIKTEVRDGTDKNEADIGKYDYVICDVPCSGLGIMAKKPEIRLKDTADFAELPHVQLDILINGYNYLKEGGRLLYSTCTLNKEENESVVRRFLETHKDAVVECEKTLLPDSSTDGFYYCVMTKGVK